MRAVVASAPLLVCAATGWEARPLEGLPRERVRVLRTGIGPRAAASALAQADGDWSWALSCGLCGALQPGMAAGDIVMDARGAPAGLLPAAREAAAGLGVPLHFGAILSSDRVLSTPAEKREAGESRRAAAVDMESGAVRAWAEDRGIPFLAVRVVLDALEDRLPSGHPEGEGWAELARYALARPLEWPLLARVGLRQRWAVRRLAAFLREVLPAL